MMVHKAQASPKTVVFPEGDHEKILRACHTLVEENIAVPILLDNAEAIHKKIPELGLDLRGVRIVDPATAPMRNRYVQELFRLRQRRGVTLTEARTLIENRNVFRVDDAAHGRCRRVGFGREPAFPRHDPSWSRNCSRASGVTQSLGMLRDDHKER